MTSAVGHRACPFDSVGVSISPFWTIPIWTLRSATMKGKGRLQKTIYTGEYAVVIRLLRQFREDAGVTQVEMAARLGQTQSFVSKVERGDRRLDIIQLRTILSHFGVTLLEFVGQLETELSGKKV